MVRRPCVPELRRKCRSEPRLRRNVLGRSRLRATESTTCGTGQYRNNTETTCAPTPGVLARTRSTGRLLGRRCGHGLNPIHGRTSKALLLGRVLPQRRPGRSPQRSVTDPAAARARMAASDSGDSDSDGESSRTGRDSGPPRLQHLRTGRRGLSGNIRSSPMRTDWESSGSSSSVPPASRTRKAGPH